MKPKTKIQVEVNRLAKFLLKPTQEQQDYAINKMFPKLCFATKSTAFCLECGSDINVKDINRNRVICNSCGENLKVEMSRKRKFTSGWGTMGMAELVTSMGYDFQVIRNFEFRCYYEKGEKKRVFFWEICQNWYEVKGKRVVNSRILSSYGNYNGDMEIREHNRLVYGYYTNNNSYNPFPDFFHPHSKFRPEYEKRGINYKVLKDIRFSRLVDLVNYSPKIETLIKLNYHNIVGAWESNIIDRYWNALKICFRNKYKIKDPNIYKDLLDAMAYLDKDLHNAHYVCPKDLIKAHDFYVHEKRKAEIGKTLASNKKKCDNVNPQYIFQKKKFFDLFFKDKEVEVRPLMSVHEFLEEGETLKHCIFTNKYYEKKNSLLFSATVKGQRVETVELCLKTFRILQNHGLGHKKSKYSERIINLIKNNIKQVRDLVIIRKRKSKKQKSAS
ncbi:PcfJ domain-containing protein [Chryseobacterium sp. SG20098]|uniref:PcfJ domain-containing protein n=1 Tax=Chryseobacterium sp. SG20098 TaxID=3074145 RepID=UPI00288315B5|nr:PcfJ domain-containing protein [Chryseobacterium sp. SG20098]WNI34679.1 PcfJ domain-containing protein [Chryseobacterium sp. SG20098]